MVDELLEMWRREKSSASRPMRGIAVTEEEAIEAEERASLLRS